VIHSRSCIPLRRQKTAIIDDRLPERITHPRSELISRLLQGKCELCDQSDQVHYTLSELGHGQVFASLPELVESPDLARLTTVARLVARPGLDARDRYEHVRRAVGDHRTGHFTDYLCFELGLRAQFIGELDAADEYLSAIGPGTSPLAAACSVWQATP
jgi:hypothetical protein